jgi:prepilin signal peptidase PulO-like enzyme (type II secretory pathway)
MHTHLINTLEETTGTGTLVGLTVSPIGVTLAALLALCTPLVLALARRRVVAQPLDVHLAEERRVVTNVLSRPGRYVYVHQLRAEHFVDTNLGTIWSLIAEVNAGVVVPTTPADERAAYELLATIESSVPTDLAAQVDERLAQSGNTTTSAALRALLDDAPDDAVPLSRKELVTDASKIYNAGVDRSEYAGSARIERTGDPLRPLRRIASHTSPLRTAISVAILAAGGYFAERLADQEAEGAAKVAIAAAISLLTIGSVIWTLVDLETMYVDTASFYILAGASWTGVLLAALLQGTLGRALIGLLGVGGIVGFIEVVNQVYRRVRGRDGMGMGDYLLALATIGVPVGITGNLLLGQVILITSLLAGIIGWGFTRLTRPGFTRETPYAFGPYLSCGWLIGVLVWMVGA